MKVLFLINCNDIGGAEFVSLFHVKAAHQAGMEVTVLSGETGNFYNEIVKLGVKIIHAPELNGTNPHTITQTLNKYLACADVVMNENWFSITKYVSIWKHAYGFKYCTIIHSNIDWVMKQLAPFDSITDRYYAIHTRIKEDLNRNHLGIGKTWVIPNCIDTSLIPAKSQKINRQLRKQYCIPKDDLVMGMVTRIAADKNILDAIRIISTVNTLRPTTLVIIGDAPNNPNCQKYKQECIEVNNCLNYPEKVKFLGKMETKEVYHHLNLFDVGLNTSPSEGLPISLLEMMCAGIYCIYPSVGDIPGELTDRGDVIPIRQRLKDSEIFAQFCYSMSEKGMFINSILELRDDIIEGVGAMARMYILQNRDIKQQNEQFIKFLTFEQPKKLTVSVLMPVYNVPIDMLDAAIKSILNQSHKDFEFVIVNDCSNNGTYATLNSFIKQDERIKIISHTENKGVAASLNTGLEMCTGDIIIRMDGDDIAEPTLIEKQVKFFQNNPESVICGVQIKGFGSHVFQTSHPSLVTAQMAAANAKYWFINHPGVAYRRQVINALGGYGENLKGMPEDYDLWCNFLNAGYVIHNHQEVLMNYRVLPGKQRSAEWFKFLEEKRKCLLKAKQH